MTQIVLISFPLDSLDIVIANSSHCWGCKGSSAGRNLNSQTPLLPAARAQIVKHRFEVWPQITPLSRRGRSASHLRRPRARDATEGKPSNAERRQTGACVTCAAPMRAKMFKRRPTSIKYICLCFFWLPSLSILLRTQVMYRGMSIHTASMTYGVRKKSLREKLRRTG